MQKFENPIVQRVYDVCQRHTKVFTHGSEAHEDFYMYDDYMFEVGLYTFKVEMKTMEIISSPIAGAVRLSTREPVAITMRLYETDEGYEKAVEQMIECATQGITPPEPPLRVLFSFDLVLIDCAQWDLDKGQTMQFKPTAENMVDIPTTMSEQFKFLLTL
jgi:hypothetical protein